VRDGLREQLVEAVVDSLVVERVAERARGIEQELGEPRLSLRVLGADRWTVTEPV
jgi:hypothetical protein